LASTRIQLPEGPAHENAASFDYWLRISGKQPRVAEGPLQFQFGDLLGGQPTIRCLLKPAVLQINSPSIPCRFFERGGGCCRASSRAILNDIRPEDRFAGQIFGNGFLLTRIQASPLLYASFQW